MTGRVHSFQSMGAVDGPGLRYVVFFQGCPLRCAYCHNPDTWAFSGGQTITVEQVLQKVRRCAPYIANGGGVTLTGGEPLAQPAFAAALLAALRAEGFHTALDTSCAAPLSAARAALEHTSLLLADLKFSTEEDYRRYTGGSLARTMEVLALAGELGVARCPPCKRWNCCLSTNSACINTRIWACLSRWRTPPPPARSIWRPCAPRWGNWPDKKFLFPLAKPAGYGIV